MARSRALLSRPGCGARCLGDCALPRTPRWRQGTGASTWLYRGPVRADRLLRRPFGRGHRTPRCVHGCRARSGEYRLASTGWRRLRLSLRAAEPHPQARAPSGQTEVRPTNSRLGPNPRSEAQKVEGLSLAAGVSTIATVLQLRQSRPAVRPSILRDPCPPTPSPTMAPSMASPAPATSSPSRTAARR